MLKKGLRQAEHDLADHRRLLSTVTEERDRLDAALQVISPAPDHVPSLTWKVHLLAPHTHGDFASAWQKRGLLEGT